jgi:hypothetical protein
MATKKKKGPPKIPQPQMVTPTTVPSFSKTEVPYQPFSVNDLLWANQRFMGQQMGYAPQLMDLYNLSAQKNAATRLSLNQQYSLPLAQLRNEQLEAVDPQFMAANRQLGDFVSKGLRFEDPIAQAVMADFTAGRNLGPGLEREVRQGIRGAQTARGNILGPSPTAQEAFGTGQAAESLWQQRLATALGMYQGREANAQNFLQGRQPTDLWPALNATEAYNPSGTYVDQSLGIQAANVASGSQANYNQSFVTAGNAYNQALISSTDVNNTGAVQAANVNNQGIQQRYSNQWDQYLYKQALSAGLLTQPGVSGGGGAGAMGMIGQGLSGAGSLLGAVGGIGTLGTAGAAGTGLLGAVGGIGTAIGGAAAGIGSGIAAGASAIGAAVSAAGAAICWLARRAIPDEWPQWREFIFTKADPELRRMYIYNARRLAMTISWEDEVHIAAAMKRALKKANETTATPPTH